MIVELYENEYQYIIKCFKELLPHYCFNIERTLYIDNSMRKLNLSNKVIYSFELNLEDKDINTIIQMKNKLARHKTLEEFEEYDKYVDFFIFIEGYCKK